MEKDEVICPECLQLTPEEELEMFGGLCEACHEEKEKD